jgi:hypothetical protein
MISGLINRFKGLLYTKTKKEVEGYIILNDSKSSKTLLLIKNGERSWRTKWFNDNEYIYKAPLQQLSTIFNM